MIICCSAVLISTLGSYYTEFKDCTQGTGELAQWLGALVPFEDSGSVLNMHLLAHKHL